MDVLVFIKSTILLIQIKTKTNSFGSLATTYFLVKEGGYSSNKYNVEELAFVDQTYKFIAIVALIESMYEEDEFIDFYQWLIRNKKKDVFPITTPKEAGLRYQAYKAEHGNTSNIVKFFRFLDVSAKVFIRNTLVISDESRKSSSPSDSEESIDVLSKLLYQIRSDFIHRAILVLEFDETAILSVRNKKPIECSIKLENLCLLFESGLLKHFDIVPDKKHI